MVFGPRVVEAVEQGKDGPSPTGAMRCVLDGDDDAIPGRRLDAPLPADRAADAVVAMRSSATARSPAAGARDTLQRAMTAGAGVLRSADSLERARTPPPWRWPRHRDPSPDGATCELANLATVGWALASGGLARTESRGAHARTDHPDVDPSQRLRYVIGGVVPGR